MSVQNHRIAVKAVVRNQEDEVLLIKRAADDVHCPDVWEIPGGRLDNGESPFGGLQREVSEEVGLEIEIGKPLCVDYFIRQDGQQITMIIFECVLVDGEVTLSHEHTEYKWLGVLEACDKIDHKMRACIEAIC